MDLTQYTWRHLADPTETEYLIDYEVAMLAWDLDSGTCDFLLRFGPNGGHCPRHRHVGVTSTLVLEGEHRVTELHTDGTAMEKVKPVGTHSLSTGDEHAHLERGGVDGAIVFFSNQAPNGVLYELVDADGYVTAEVRIADLVRGWGPEA